MATEKDQSQPSPEEGGTTPQIGNTNDAPSTNSLDHAQLISRLILLNLTLRGQSRGVVEQLCQEVTLTTQGQVQLSLFQQNSMQAPSAHLPYSILVEIEDRLYGKLLFAPDPLQPAAPIVSFPIMNMLALFCGYLLYDLERAAFTRGEYKLIRHQASLSFTRREQDVLELMYRGYNSEAITSILQITEGTVRKYREHIYAKFDVHSEQGVLSAAFAAGLFYPIENLTPQIMKTPQNQGG